MKDEDDNSMWLFIFIIIFIAAACSSCRGPQATEKTIVSIKHDTVITPLLKRDTIFNNTASHDTVFLREKQLTIKYFQKTDTSAYLGGIVLPDTVVKVYRDTLREKTIIQQVAKPKTKWDWLQYWVTVILVIIVTIKYGGPFVMALLRKIPNFPF